MKNNVERIREISLKRNKLLKTRLDKIDNPNIKAAKSKNELTQALCLIYKVYFESGYITEANESEMLFNIYHLLPETVVLVAKSNASVISTMTQVFDSELFGLPMDTLYSKELDALRQKGRTISEISGLATLKSFRWYNLFAYLLNIMYRYAHYKKVNDICITVNPKHAQFYKSVFLFEQFGDEKYYSKVNAPAVALRWDMDNIEKKFKEVYGKMDNDCNLFWYLHKMTLNKATEYSPDFIADKRFIDTETAKYFIDSNQNIANNISMDGTNYLKNVYPGLKI